MVFFFFYPNLIELEILPGLLLLLRNIFVIWLAIGLLMSGTTAVGRQQPLFQITPRTRKYLIYIPVVLLFVWGTIAAFRPVRNADVWMNLRVAEYFGGRDAIVVNARRLLGQQPPEGTNHVIVAHDNVAINSTSVYPDEGEGLVFKPRGGSDFEFVGRLPAEEWRRLAQEM